MSEIVPLSAARRALAEADTLPDIASLVNYAEAAKVAAKRAGLAEEAQRDWALFSLEAQRRAGQLLADMPGYGRGRPDANSVTVTDLEIDHNKAKRWQQVAAVSDDVWEHYTGTAVEPTRGRLLRLARYESARVAYDAKQALDAPAAPPEADIRVGDFRTVLGDLGDVDAIICDPPYEHEYLPLLADLARFADRILTANGVLAVMTGVMYLPEIFDELKDGRPYRWTVAYVTPGSATTIYPRDIVQGWKPVILYGGGPRQYDVVTSQADDKAHHHWGQSLNGFTELVTRLTAPGEHVVDPFLGGGTTALACRNTGRRFTGCDVDPDAVATTRRRLG